VRSQLVATTKRLAAAGSRRTTGSACELVRELTAASDAAIDAKPASTLERTRSAANSRHN
jgi:hypothetical protein